ncbi:MAG: hypothetical protein ACOY4R_27610 [Pseudomonadota bacterium]
MQYEIVMVLSFAIVFGLTACGSREPVRQPYEISGEAYKRCVAQKSPQACQSERAVFEADVQTTLTKARQNADNAALQRQMMATGAMLLSNSQPQNVYVYRGW